MVSLVDYVAVGVAQASRAGQIPLPHHHGQAQVVQNLEHMEMFVQVEIAVLMDLSEINLVDIRVRAEAGRFVVEEDNFHFTTVAFPA